MSDGGRILNRRTFFPGDVIFNEGDRGSQAFILQSGRVRITKNVSGGRRGTLGFVEPGGIFGEMALIDQSQRMATAIADQSCVCIVITEEALKGKLAKTDPVLRMLMLMLIRLLRRVADDTPIPPDDLAALAREASAQTRDGTSQPRGDRTDG
ncbi:cyclic nucleotide-binding domain-containing protein [Pacificispira sp.]|uniref:cyclic nucleotide-binding domain-containing protein n=1 Tax=Pacificispira sp. TaxID=2888761 RepID=UPI003BABE11A